MHFHWSSSNDSKKHPRRGGGARHGRAWWHFDSPDGGARLEGVTVAVEWAFLWSAACHLTFKAERGDGVGVQFSIAVPWVCQLYLTLTGGVWARIARRLLPEFAKDQRSSYPGQELPVRDYSDRVFGVSVHDKAIWWDVWVDPNSWSSKTPKWRDGCWHPLDTLLGRTKVTDTELERRAVLIPMPERSYAATVVIERRIWKRPRWPFASHNILGADVDMKQDPIPHPGKGTTDYNCGEDATYGSSFPCPTGSVEDAIGHVVASSLETRTERGGANWRPKEDHRPKPKQPAPPAADAQG